LLRAARPSHPVSINAGHSERSEESATRSRIPRCARNDRRKRLVAASQAQVRAGIGLPVRPPSTFWRDVGRRLLPNRPGPIGLVAVSLALVAGTLLGLVAGFLGGWLDGLSMRLMDVILAFPATLLAIGIVSARGPGLFNTMLAIGVVSIPIYARVTRSSVLS